MIGAWKKTETSQSSGTQPFTSSLPNSTVFGRNLRKNQLGGVIFGCKNATMKECLYKQLFGLPAQHFSYVKNIDPGLPLFLFNYSDRKLHGIFEAASSGKMYIDPYGWTTDGLERTQYPAQVQIRVQLQCQPLSEDKFRQAIADNYYNHNHFWFELDHGQTAKLISLLSSSLAIAPSNSVPQNTHQWSPVSQPLPSHETPWDDRYIQPLDTRKDGKEEKQDEKNIIVQKLKALYCESQDLSLPNKGNDTPGLNNTEKGYVEASGGLNKKEESPIPPFEYQYNIAQLVQEVNELTNFKKKQTDKNCYLEQKLIEAEMEIQHLRDRCALLESACNITNHPTHVEQTQMKSTVELHLDPKDSLFLIGGFDGNSWLETMDLYSTSQNMIKSLKPMSSVRSYASAVWLNGEIYVFGGGNGYVWYDTVESYNPVHDSWASCPSLNKKKGSLSGAALNNKIFAVGGGNGVDCFSDVEMLDLDIGRWIPTRSMLDKRFALASVEHDGVLYATGGYDGNDYLKSAERFDPREHSWTKIPNMNTKRGCHSLVVLNEKLYALGGFDGEEMVPSVEMFDPRLGAWTVGKPMNHPRGYSAAVVVNESIYMVGGIKGGENIVDTVENYKEGRGWQETSTVAAVKRCFLSAIACNHE
ncbi:kelch-like protein 3 isoform X2 [Abrus precatorius]|uniref:Kelch-like protein 3 isoform X2 n=2 Tax=Abrus precatorius TaxID=3816 RepID=A0A8B8L7W1_ABRPR|nr:kelch-like protein 3 isoform X2 [Abrus precatorius]